MNLIRTSISLAAADADGIAASQTLAAAGPLALNGALTSNVDADSIAEAQTLSGAGLVLLNGDLVTDPDVPIAYISNTFGGGLQVTITSAGDDSGITFTVTGTIYQANHGVGPITVQEVLTGSNAGVVATRNTYATVGTVFASGATAGDVTIGTTGTAQIAASGTERQVILTSGGDDSGITFTITGTNAEGNVISEILAGANTAAAASALYYQTVTQIVSSAATTGTITAGTNGVGAARIVALDQYAPAPTAIQVVLDGTVNFTVQQTLDDPNVLGLGDVTWFPHPDSALANAAANAQGNYAYLPPFMRLQINSGTGTAIMTVLQASNAPGSQ